MSFIIISVILFILAIIEDRTLFKISAVAVTLFYSLTLAYGYDWMNYYDTFVNVQQGDLDSFFTEPGYLLLMQVANIFGMQFPLFTGLVTLLMYISICVYCSKMKNPSLAFFTLFSFLGFFMLTEQVRQGLAICILLFGILTLLNGKVKTFIIFTLAATLFHISSVIALLFLFFRRNNNAVGMIKFSAIASAFVFVLLFSLYNPDLFSSIPFIGSKIAAYARHSAEKDIGFWTYILGSRLVLIYFILYVYLFIFHKYDKSIYSGLGAVFVLFLTRLSPYLIRVGYFFVPYLVISIDPYMSKQGRGLHTRFNKLIYMVIIFSISTIPAWNPVYWQGAKTHLNIFSQANDVNAEILRKCLILRENYDHIEIVQCKW